MSARERAKRLLETEASRGEVKRWADELDRDPALRRAVFDLGRARGAELPDDALGWPAKKLLRLARAREEDARERSNPIRRDEDFDCAHCGRHVAAHGRTARDHCPHCLRSRHVDVVPGDRAADCGGLLDPVGVDRRGADWVIRYLCRDCGAEKVNRAALDGDPPDDWDAVCALSAAPPTQRPANPTTGRGSPR